MKLNFKKTETVDKKDPKIHKVTLEAKMPEELVPKEMVKMHKITKKISLKKYQKNYEKIKWK